MSTDARSAFIRNVQALLVQTALRGSTLLHIENDESGQAFVAENMLRAFHAFVRNARDGAAALEIARKEKITAILADWLLDDPEYSGLHAVADIQKEFGPSVPAILHSAYLENNEECQREAKKAGANIDYFVRKKASDSRDIEDALIAAICDRLNLHEKLEELANEIMLHRNIGLCPECEKKSSHRGVVEHIAADESGIRFTDGEKDFLVKIPTWRLIKASADEYGCEVEHTIYACGTKMISDLVLLSEGATLDGGDVETISPELLQRLVRRVKGKKNNGG